MKVNICDVCRKRHQKFVETTRYISVRGRRELKMDLCDVHMKEGLALPMQGYIRLRFAGEIRCWEEAGFNKETIKEMLGNLTTAPIK